MAPNFDAFHFRIQNYKKNLIYANEIAKNVRNICENVRNLMESAIKRRTPVAKMRRKRDKQNLPTMLSRDYVFDYYMT